MLDSNATLYEKSIQRGLVCMLGIVENIGLVSQKLLNKYVEFSFLGVDQKEIKKHIFYTYI